MEYYPDSMMEDVWLMRGEKIRWSTIAVKYNTHEEKLRSAFRRWKIRTKKGMWAGVLHPEVAPYVLDHPLPEVTVDHEPWKGKQIYTQVIMGDIHAPYQDDRAVAVLLEILSDAQPDSVVNLGDMVDCYTLSDFMRDPNRKESLQDEIDIARGINLMLRQAVPNADIEQFEGNHEERLRRALWRAEKTQAVVFQLTNVKRELTWPKLLDLDGVGIKWNPTGTIKEIAPNFYAHHGDCGGDPFNKFQVSGTSGHIHKFIMRTSRTIKEQIEWFTCPTLGTLNPEYDCHPQWQQGFWFITHDLEAGTRYAEPIRIQDGGALFHGRKYTA